MRCLLLLPLFFAAALSAFCGGNPFFEFTFRPIEAGPVNAEDDKDSHGRCGHEDMCDLTIQLYGKERCKRDKTELQMDAPDNVNKVDGSQFEPNFINWQTHGDWALSSADDSPFALTLCDRDSGFRGGNDEIFHVMHQRLDPGCGIYTHEDDDEKHPWYMKYEICCRPLTDSNRRGQGAGQGDLY